MREDSGWGWYRRETKEKMIQNISSGMQVILFKFGLAGIWKIWGVSRFWNELDKSPDF
jgi:lipopolysaccharide/colanic/teichoic acid biosynthesis glycosyltransferase